MGWDGLGWAGGRSGSTQCKKGIDECAATPVAPISMPGVNHPLVGLERSRGIWYNCPMKNDFSGTKYEIGGTNYEISPTNFLISPINWKISPINFIISPTNFT